MRTGSQQTTYMFGMAFLVALLCIGPWGKVANKKGSRNTMMISAVLYGLALVPLPSAQVWNLRNR